ncbi:MAG TPA: ABC transporter substrate-binding protein [Frankiaceae bacterium]|jgi:ABC-type branched-subunit amino acid transport system substrate-binding protein|nr:ABC transporter substrate-binding protein [Frankiaceae bacterium]
MSRRPTLNAIATPVAIGAVVALTLAACGRSSNTPTTTPSSGTSSAASPTASAAAAGDFGDLKAICGPGNATGGSGRGISASSINIGTMADPGAAAAPGLGQEFFQVGQAFAKWCNAAGGINGRKIVLTDYDAKLFNVGQEMISACQKEFMLVGNGNAFDAPGVKPRLACKLGQISAYADSPEATSSALQVQATPNPANEFQIGPFRLLSLKYPDTLKSGIAVGSSNIASLRPQGLRTQEAVKQIGFKVADYSERPPLVTNWRPYMAEIKNSGAQGYMNATGSAAYIAPELTSIKDVGLKLTWMLLGNAYYEPQTIAAVKSVGTSQPTYQYFSHLPFEMTDEPVVKEIKSIMSAGTTSPTYTDFTALAFNAWTLWAKSATACGNDLTQDCVLQKAGSETAWTAGGLFPPRNTDPSNPQQPTCYVIMDVTPNGFVYDKAVTQPNKGIYNCDPKNVVPLKNTFQSSS